MNTRIKRLCAWVLTIVMMAGMFPVSAFAGELGDFFQMDLPEAFMNALGSWESAQEPTLYSTAEQVGERPEVKQEAELQFSDTSDPEERQEAAGVDYGSGTGETPSAEKAVSEDPAARPSNGEDEQKKTVADFVFTQSFNGKEESEQLPAGNSHDARAEASLTPAPAFAAEQDPKYEELLINRQYEMTYVEPEEPIVFRMKVEKEQNIHFAAEGMDLTMTVFNERTKGSKFEEAVDLLNGEDNAWFFEADSYLFELYSKAAVSGSVILRIMDDKTAEEFFYPEGTPFAVQTAGDFNSFLDNFFSNEDNETVDRSDTDFSAAPLTDTVTVETSSLSENDQNTPENASLAPEAESADISDVVIGAEPEGNSEPEPTWKLSPTRKLNSNPKQSPHLK